MIILSTNEAIVQMPPNLAYDGMIMIMMVRHDELVDLMRSVME